ncbi:hypothetical protein [Chitinophaga sancti]|uniref:Outer membrane protein beta-barrel domain-containing protein n=1 Tax=Chitinophaga sancti TaxID=1004 RepID=A0A1K1RUL3_9BACT|nr:hypothetical protein [Chitinophaga sancti]WQD62357.1 hypothetical protein U0033_31175 [Chitinophaga sancti]WQG92074.1 hypothetical protein SR876_11210 [Chitinophaga sancti]SFW75737.1 hypothetical protein SAMN05661012_04281 [Chitinophaga sancti]
MKNKSKPVPFTFGVLVSLLPLFAFLTSSAQSYTLKIKKGDYWLGGGLGIQGSVAPMGQYIGTSASLSAKGGYFVADKFSIGITVTGGYSIVDKKDKGVYNRGISFLMGPLFNYHIPISRNFFLEPIICTTWGPVSVKSMVSASPEQYVKVKGHAFCEIGGIGPFFEVIPQKAEFGVQLLLAVLQQSTTVYGSNGEAIPGSKVWDNKTGPAMNVEFRLHF